MANYVCMCSTYILYKRCEQKNPLFSFFRKVFIYLAILSWPLKSNPSDIIHLCQRFFQSSKHLWKALLLSPLWSSCFDFSFISLIVGKRFPFIGVFSFEKRKKSAENKSGTYCGWGMITHNHAQASMCELVRYHAAKSMIGVFHNSVRFWQIASRNRRIISR